MREAVSLPNGPSLGRVSSEIDAALGFDSDVEKKLKRRNDPISYRGALKRRVAHDRRSSTGGGTTERNDESAELPIPSPVAETVAPPQKKKSKKRPHYDSGVVETRETVPKKPTSSISRTRPSRLGRPRRGRLTSLALSRRRGTIPSILGRKVAWAGITECCASIWSRSRDDSNRRSLARSQPEKKRKEEEDGSLRRASFVEDDVEPPAAKDLPPESGVRGSAPENVIPEEPTSERAAESVPTVEEANVVLSSDSSSSQQEDRAADDDDDDTVEESGAKDEESSRRDASEEPPKDSGDIVANSSDANVLICILEVICLFDDDVEPPAAKDLPPESGVRGSAPENVIPEEPTSERAAESVPTGEEANVVLSSDSSSSQQEDRAADDDDGDTVDESGAKDEESSRRDASEEPP
ncbi:hypothetical protein Bca52824_035643 [Brassica carinata]|uniref:Uncharacterized protein n=1 Tax=Brassica carinata TaxID=52824 RepID=A0A8X7S426_BRACI|nr:hypothetical protein Bca52824_035643 [Brassica carinata]